jgi:hypothetical protein
LNVFIQYDHFKMEGIYYSICFSHRIGWGKSIRSKDSYFVIPCSVGTSQKVLSVYLERYTPRAVCMPPLRFGH